MKLRQISIAAAAAAAALAAGTASASLVLVGPEPTIGTGLGTVNTVLAIQGNGNATTESGAVAWDGSTDVLTGDAKSGASQTLTRSFSDLSVASAADLRVVFNAVETDSAITLSDLVLSIYAPTGGVLFSSGPFSSQSFTGTFNGIGQSGFVFGLDAAQAAAAQAFYAPGNRVGLSASATGSNAGPETFYIGSAAAVTTPIPEPGTYAMLLAGLGAIGFVARRRAAR